MRNPVEIILAILLTGAAIIGSVSEASSEVRKVKGSYTYYGDKNDSPAMSKRKALEGARLEALAAEYGTIVSQDLLQSARSGVDGEGSKFLALSSTEVKGEWIADDGEPVYTVCLGEDDCLIVSCTIAGTAKRISNEAVDFEVLALRNGTTKGNSATEYHDGDQLFLWFSAPTDGYLAVFLMTEGGEVVKLLPYRSDSSQEVHVKKGYDYVFFDDTRHQGDFGEIDTFEVTVDEEVEFNKMYVVFSPNRFSTPAMHPAPTVQSLPFVTETEFSKWLVRNRKADPRMGVRQINLKLLPR